MNNLFYPKEYLDDVFSLTPNRLKELGIDTVIFDIDNTLVPYFVKYPTKECLKYFRNLKEAGIAIGVLSNSRRERAENFCEGLGIPYIWKAKKPLSKGLNELLKIMGAKAEKCAVVGDQIFTDVLLGNLNGIYSVMVKKVDKRDELITAVKRPLEKIILFFYFRRVKNGK